MRKLVLAALAASAVGAFTLGGTLAGSGSASSVSERSRSLSAFESCGELVGYAKRHALRLVGPYGLPGSSGSGFAVPAVEAGDEASAPIAPSAPASPVTNLQEPGVDEPDIVKAADGVIFALARGELQAIDTSSPEPRLVGSLALENGWSSRLLLAGSRLLVIGAGGFWIEPLAASEIAPIPQTLTTTLTEVDVSDPEAMQVVGSLTVDGGYVDARERGGTVRVIVASQPGGFEFTAPASDRPADVRTAEEANRNEIRSSTLASWMPRYRVSRPGAAEAAESRPLVPCTEVHRPRVFSGLGMLSVLTIDLARGVEPVDADAVLGAGETVYSSATGLYVATQRWLDPASLAQAEPPTVSTAIHKFDVTSPEATDYRASGSVPGYLLNQWSLSEHDRFLRVVSTDAPSWWGGPEAESASRVSVLREQEGRLVTVGRAGDLGRGERVYAVRFVGELGFVVTFRQVDPLHVVDLSDPERPRVRGELELPGYSAYLHPIGAGVLLGVGQDATAEGRLLGVQVSVFDVSDPDDPRRLHHLVLGEGYTEAEWDHHAFLYHRPAGLAVLPFETGWIDPPGLQTRWSGAVALRVGREGILQLRSISHEAATPEQPPPIEPTGEPEVEAGSYPVPIRRFLVLDGVLYTVSEAGVKATSLETLADTAWVPFG